MKAFMELTATAAVLLVLAALSVMFVLTASAPRRPYWGDVVVGGPVAAPVASQSPIGDGLFTPLPSADFSAPRPR